MCKNKDKDFSENIIIIKIFAVKEAAKNFCENVCEKLCKISVKNFDEKKTAKNFCEDVCEKKIFDLLAWRSLT